MFVNPAVGNNVDDHVASLGLVKSALKDANVIGVQKLDIAIIDQHCQQSSWYAGLRGCWDYSNVECVGV